jgi:hypothetical protein
MMTKEDKVARLKRLVNGADILSINITIERHLVSKPLFDQSEEFKAWHNDVQDTVKAVFGRHSHYLDDFKEIKFRQLTSTLLGRTEDLEREYLKGLDKAKALLNSMLREIGETPEATVQDQEQKRAAAPGRARIKQRVFIGHGRESPVGALTGLFRKGVGARNR